MPFAKLKIIKNLTYVNILNMKEGLGTLVLLQMAQEQQTISVNCLSTLTTSH